MSLEILNAEMQEAIKKNLPSQVSETLQQELASGNKAKKDLETSQALVEQQKDTISDLRRKVSELESLGNTKRDLDIRKESLDEQERKQKIETLEYQLAAEKDKTKFAHDISLGLVRNTEFRKSVFGGKTEQGYYDNNIHQQIQPKNENYNHNETETLG